MRANGAPVSNDIRPALLKALGPRARQELQDIFNPSFSTGKWPQIWKATVILPLKKGKPPGCISSYRPVSVASFVAQTFENILHGRLYNLAETRDWLCTEQVGSQREAVPTLLECTWAPMGQWKVFTEGKLAPTTGSRGLQTILLLADQLTVYTDGSATARTKDGGAGVIVTCGDPAEPTILHCSHLHGAAFTPSFALEPPMTLQGPPPTHRRNP